MVVVVVVVVVLVVVGEVVLVVVVVGLSTARAALLSLLGKHTILQDQPSDLRDTFLEALCNKTARLKRSRLNPSVLTTNAFFLLNNKYRFV